MTSYREVGGTSGACGDPPPFGGDHGVSESLSYSFEDEETNPQFDGSRVRLVPPLTQCQCRAYGLPLVHFLLLALIAYIISYAARSIDTTH